MRNYSLQSNETILYKGEVFLPNRKGSAEITLTNLNIVLSTTIRKKLFSKAEIEVEFYPVINIKLYNEEPQIKQKGNDIEMFFTDRELLMRFNSKIEMTKFKMAAIKLVRGKSLHVRGADKVKETLNLVNETLGVDTLQTVKGVLEKGIVGSVMGGLGNKNKNHDFHTKTEITKDSISLARELVSQNSLNKVNETEKRDPLSYDQQIEVIKRLKELLDNDIITQEEYDAKKKEVLGI